MGWFSWRNLLVLLRRYIPHSHKLLYEEREHLQLILCLQLRNFLQLCNLDHVWISRLILELNELPLLGDEHLLLSLDYFVFSVKLKFKLLLIYLQGLPNDLKRLGFCANADHGCCFG